MQSIVPVSGSTVALILSLAVLAGGQLQQGLCKEGCSELPEGRYCADEHSDLPTREELEDSSRAMNTDPTCQSCRDSDCLAPNSPKLSIELQHHSLTEFGIAITWELPDNVMEDVNLILTDSPSKTCHDLPNPGFEPPQCASLPPDYTQPYHFTYLYRYTSSGMVKQTLYVKLTAYFQDNCTATTTEMVTVPESCHTLHPGNCQLCGVKDLETSDILLAGNVTVSPCQHVNQSTWEVFISWDVYVSISKEEKLLHPCENCSYYLTIFKEPEGTEATPQLKVVGGRTNVTLQNLTAPQHYSVNVLPYDCSDCSSRSNNKKVEFSLGSALYPTPSNQLNPVTSIENSTPAKESVICLTTSSQLNPMTTIQMVENSTPAPWTTTSRPMTSDSKMVLNSTPSPTPTSLNPITSPTPTNTDGIQSMAIYIPVGFMVVMVITIAILVGVMHKRLTRNTPTTRDSKSDNKISQIYLDIPIGSISSPLPSSPQDIYNTCKSVQ